MAESLSAYFHSLGVTGSEPLQQESSPPPLQEDSDDDVPDLLEAESDSDSEGVPELVADLSGVSNYDDMPELVSDDDEPPPLVGEDSDDEVNDDDTPPPLVDEDSDEEDDLPELESVPFDAQRGLPRQSYGLGKSTIGNLEGFSARGVAWEESGIGATSLSVQYQSEAWKGLILTDTAGQSAPAEPLRSPVDCPRLGDQGLVKGEERLVLGPRGAKQADPQEWSTGLFDCCSDVPTCLLGALCPCVLYGKTHRLATGRSSIASAFAHIFAMLGGGFLGGCFLCHWGYAPCAAAPLRSAIRGKYGLAATGPFELASEAEGRLADCFVHYWCHPCALCQEHREVKFRMALETGGTYTAPPVIEEMEKRVIPEPVKSVGAKGEAGGVYYTLLAGE